MSKAKKYEIGKLTRKDLLAALELILDPANDEDTVVVTFRRYEIRARRLPHGVELKWGKSGTFWQPALNKGWRRVA